MDRLTEQQAGNKATAKWANQVVDELRRQHLIPGNGIRVTVTGSGTVIALDIPQQAGSTAEVDPSVDSCFPVEIISQTANKAFLGAKYRIVGKTYSSSSTETDPIYFPHITPSTVFPIGCTVLAHRLNAPIFQSSND